MDEFGYNIALSIICGGCFKLVHSDSNCIDHRLFVVTIRRFPLYHALIVPLACSGLYFTPLEFQLDWRVSKIISKIGEKTEQWLQVSSNF